MIAEDKVGRLWGHLEKQFNLAVRSVGIGELPNGQEYLHVMVDDQTDPLIIKTLPGTFENEQVRYQGGKQPQAQNDCGQPGHVCQCGTKTPKP